MIQTAITTLASAARNATITLSLSCCAFAQSPLPSFPGAEGFGALASGGRHGKVVFVTNLDDSGPGSLREAINMHEPRTILFRVAGNIELKSPLKIRHGNLTLAGQSAPGDGICLQGYGLTISQAENVIIRYLRIRPGDTSGVELDALNSREARNVIIDHCSMSWAIDECVSLYGNTHDITVQWCLISESLYQSVHKKGAHGYGGIWGGQNASWHHNLLAHHSSRNPRIVGQSEPDQLVDVRNNVFYNWGFNSTYGGDGDVRVNLVGNYYKPGPATKTSVRNRIANPSAGFLPNNWWIDSNHATESKEITQNNWLGVTPAKPIAKTKSEKTIPIQLSDLRANAPFVVAQVSTQNAVEAYSLVVQSAGATLPVRDALDTRIALETRSGTARFGKSFEGGNNGIIDSQRDVGGWPLLNSSPAPQDTDADGLPDIWEKSHRFNPDDPSDGATDQDGDGYTQLEEWLNGTDPRKS